MRRVCLLLIVLVISVMNAGCKGNFGNQGDVSDTLQNGQGNVSDELQKEQGDGSRISQEEQEMQDINLLQIEKDNDFKADFLGVDSGDIQICRIYHGEGQEEVGLTTAKGKYFVRMLSGFLDSPKYEFSLLEGGLMMDGAGALGEEAKQHADKYYIFLRFRKPPTAILSERLEPCTKYTEIIMPYDNVIVCVDPEDGRIGLEGFYDASVGGRGFKSLTYSWPMPEVLDEFQRKYEVWQDTEDWQAAFDKLDKEEEALEADIEKAAAEEASRRANDGQASFLGVGVSQIQSCKVYHGTGQEELDLTTEKGAGFLQMLSGFFDGKRYTYDYYLNSSIQDGYLENLEESAAENEANYYILLQFAQPPSILLEDRARESVITINNYDGIIFEVDPEKKNLLLNTHYEENEKSVFLSSIGIRKQKAAKQFLQEYEAWEQRYENR